MRTPLPDAFTLRAEDITNIARSRLKGVDIDSAYEALMEADNNGEAVPDELTDAQAWALRALGWVSWAYEAHNNDNYVDGEDWGCLENARNCLGESTHHARKPAEFSAMQATRGKKKRGRISPLKQTLQKIDGFDAFLTMMESEGLLDFNESDPPHPCKLCDIEDGRLWYVVRKSGENKSVTLIRVQNIFRYELNK